MLHVFDEMAVLYQDHEKIFLYEEGGHDVDWADREIV